MNTNQIGIDQLGRNDWVEYKNENDFGITILLNHKQRYV